MDENKLKETLRSFVEEDVGSGDVTTKHTPDTELNAVIKTRQDCVLSGIEECLLLLSMKGVSVSENKKDGEHASSGETIMKLNGGARNILTLERTLLNILSRMSGIATHTNRYVKLVSDNRLRAQVAATRKTTPLFRFFEKKAVVAGGGVPHRMGLYDRVLIKDNHLVVFGGAGKAVEALKKESEPGLLVEVEVKNLKDAILAIEAGAEIIMLDNMTPELAKQTITEIVGRGLRDKVIIEVSGGVKLGNVVEYAKTGADVLSTSDITCAAPPIDFTLSVV